VGYLSKMGGMSRVKKLRMSDQSGRDLLSAYILGPVHFLFRTTEPIAEAPTRLPGQAA
jgi:hypothetical protein